MSEHVNNIVLVLIPALPLLACLLVAFGGKWLGEKSHLPVAAAIGGSFILSLVLLFQVQAGV
jgi:NADH:ubiquinone oxidoreductase subunit 5 (subunit L)/multisubunit Na+/H+ antiporter MnhA subunit